MHYLLLLLLHFVLCCGLFFSKAFDSQDGKQLEESESTASLLELVQVGFVNKATCHFVI